MSVQQRRKYDQEFKRNTLLLCAEPCRTVSEVGRNLGINKDLPYRGGGNIITAKGNMHSQVMAGEALTSEQKRIRELEKQLKDAKIERDILKKAMAIFSRTSK